MKSYAHRLIKPCLWMILLFFGSETLAAITVQVNPPKVQPGDTFRLTFTMDDAQTDAVPDLTALQQDFIIVGSERKMSYTLINGQERSMKQWTVLLRPQKTGVIPIPSIQIGQEKTKATRVEVTKESTPAGSNAQTASQPSEVMLTTQVSQANPFVNQQVIYTVKLYNSGRLLDAEYKPPKVKDGLLIPLGDASHYQTVENGQSYVLEEQRYAIFPQKSGEFQIIGPSFHALVYDVVPRGVHVRSKVTKLTVKPVPDHYKGKYWLPAKQVSLTEQYDKSDETFSQGSTLVRTVSLQAVGVPAQLLPALEFKSQPQFSVYPERPKEHNAIRAQELVGKTTIKVTYLLNQAGRITIPALRLPWFNTVTAQEEVATLPSRTLEIKPKAGVMSPVSPAPTPVGEKKRAVVTESKALMAPSVEKPRPILWWVAIGFGFAWILTLFLWWFRSRSHSGVGKRQALKQLQVACDHNNASEARDALLRWATKQWPDVEFLNLNDLIKQIQYPAFKKQIQLLSQALYSQDKKTPWRGSDLWGSVRTDQKRKSNRKNKSNDLPPMNPM